MENHGTHATRHHQRPHLWLLAVIAVVHVGWALHAMAVVLVPIVCSIFVALLVFPVDKWVAERMPDRLTRVGHAARSASSSSSSGFFIGSIWLAAERVEERFPETFPDVDELWPNLGDAS